MHGILGEACEETAGARAPAIGRPPRSRTLIQCYARLRPMAQVADHFVGRAAELEAIDRALGDAARGPDRSLVEGEPGIGKTRLLAELRRRADARGCTVLDGSASELERDLPFWVFVDALDEYVAGLDPRLVASLGDEVRRSSRTCCRCCRRPRPAARRRCRTSATARIAPCASCSSASRRAARSC